MYRLFGTSVPHGLASNPMGYEMKPQNTHIECAKLVDDNGGCDAQSQVPDMVVAKLITKEGHPCP